MRDVKRRDVYLMVVTAAIVTVFTATHATRVYVWGAAAIFALSSYALIRYSHHEEPRDYAADAIVSAVLCSLWPGVVAVLAGSFTWFLVSRRRSS